MVNEQQLVKMLTEGYVIDFEDQPFYLFKSLPFNELFSRITNIIYLTGKGLLLIGEHVTVNP